MDPLVYPKGHVKPEDLEKVLVPFGYDDSPSLWDRTHRHYRTRSDNPALLLGMDTLIYPKGHVSRRMTGI